VVVHNYNNNKNLTLFYLTITEWFDHGGISRSVAIIRLGFDKEPYW